MPHNIIFVVFLVYLLGCSEATETGSRRKLVIDHDGGADDAFAITLSLLNEKYFDGPKVVALTTTFGNVNLNQTIINSDRILALCNRQDIRLPRDVFLHRCRKEDNSECLYRIPIYSGAYHALIAELESDHYYGYDGLGDDGYSPSAPIKIQDEPAAVALLELSKRYEGELIVVAIGPVTNIALAARLDPEFIGRLAHLYVGAGHIYSDVHSIPEFNAYMDPEAYHIVADSAVLDKVTFVAFSQIRLTLNTSVEWRKNVLGKIQTPLMQALNGFERISLPKKTSWHKLDPAVAAVALDNDIVDEFRNTYNDIILEGDKKGINTNDFSSTNPNARMIYAANIERYKKFLLDLYSAELIP